MGVRGLGVERHPHPHTSTHPSMSGEVCFQHPDRLAVEHCEVCRRPVCGSCLWYAESGERLCPDHAAEFQRVRKDVIPPERYAAGIAHSQAAAARPSAQEAPYKGNSTDVGALVAAVSGVVALASCAGVAWVIPLVAFFLGLVSWLQARDSLDPRRTRWLAGLGLAGGGIFVLFIVGFMALMFLCFLFPVLASTFISTPVAPTPTP